jgi:hypothetical protein
VIDEKAFKGCTALKSITIPEGLENINVEAFCDCTSLESVTLPAGVKKIHAEAFIGCEALKTIYIPAKKTEYYKKRLSGALLVEQESAPSTKSAKKAATKTAEKAPAKKAEPKFKIVETTCTLYIDGKPVDFLEQRLDSVKLPKSFTGPLEIPSHVTKIARLACSDLKQLTEVILPDGVTDIDFKAFDGCWNLEKINIPDSMSFLDIDCFANCLSLKELHLPAGLVVRNDMLNRPVTEVWGVPETTKVTIAEGSKFYIKGGVIYSKEE